jgi:GT2 family glycosyltransferase
MDDPLVSIILRSFNEGWALRETLSALKAQEYKNWELIVIDSGSTDGSVELIRRAQPQHFVQIAPHEYHPARVMNHGMRLARSEFGIFLNADATPQGTGWLRPLAEKLFDPQIAAVFGKQIPRSDCQAVFAHDYERCFGRWSEVPDEPRIDASGSAREDAHPTIIFTDNRESKNWEHFFSMASSGIRRDVWNKRGFNELMRYSEDDEYTRWCRAQGWQVVYAPESVVMHSHNYTPQEAYRRSFGEARALAAVWTGRRTDFHFARTVLFGWLNDARRDWFFCVRNRRLREWPHALRVRWQQRRARLAGFQDGWKIYRENETDGRVHPPTWFEREPAG